MVRLLAAVDDSNSLHDSQFHGWGPAFMSHLFFDLEVQLECRFHATPPAGGSAAGTSPWAWEGPQAPAFTSPAFVEKAGDKFHGYYAIFLCQAPPAGASEQEAAAAAGASLDQADRVRSEGRFEVQLAATLNGTDLKMSRLPLCRCDDDFISRPFEVLLTQPISAGGASDDPSGSEAEAEGGRGGGGGAVEQKSAGVKDERWGATPGASLDRLPSFQIAGHGESGTLHYLPRGDASGGAARVLVDGEEAWVVAPRARRAGGSRVEEGHAFQVAVCVRPFANAKPFASEKERPTYSDARILEWVDAHLLAGVDHIYFFDRDYERRRDLLQAYVRRGQLLHLPFPDYSEVHYRLAFKESNQPYTFPLIYEQVLAYELCPMLGRRYGDTWQFHTDVDEFLLTNRPEHGSMKHQLARALAAEEASRGVRLRMLSLKRFNVPGVVTEATRLDPVLAFRQRCKLPMWQQDGWQGWKDKLAVSPAVMIPFENNVHRSMHMLEKFMYMIPSDVIHIFHYTSSTIDFNVENACRENRDNDNSVVEDERMAGVPSEVDYEPASSKRRRKGGGRDTALQTAAGAGRHEGRLLLLLTGTG
eukprot:jgi/Mesen1/1855/ME000143S00905